MKLFLASDIHSEFYNYNAEFPWFFDGLDTSNVDVCVLAGDILLGRNSVQILHKFCQVFPQVIYVAGNHEFYQGEFHSITRRFRNLTLNLPNLHFLEKDTVEIAGRRFVGCTLWYNHPDCATYEYMLNDFRLIHNEEKPHRQFIYKYAAESKHWLKQTVRPGDIVVTHMLPSDGCIDEMYRGDPTNCFYSHACDAIIAENKPALWMHGHSHNHYDDKIYDTRVIRNPFGYPGQNTGFKKDLRIEV